MHSSTLNGITAKTILRIDSSARQNGSMTRKLADEAESFALQMLDQWLPESQAA